MSDRSKAHATILKFIEDNQSQFTAPYGIIVDNSVNRQSGGIIARKITFGIARTLDATVWVWAADSIEIRASGPLYRIAGLGLSVSEVLNRLRSIIK